MCRLMRSRARKPVSVSHTLSDTYRYKVLKCFHLFGVLSQRLELTDLLIGDMYMHVQEHVEDLRTASGHA